MSHPISLLQRRSMKLRQTLAMGAVSALVAPALAFTATSFAFADETQPSLTVTAPKVLGVGGKAVEFNADIKGLGTGGEEESQSTRLYFTLDLASYFKDLTGKYRNHGIVLEYLDPHGDPGDWNEVEFSRDGSKLSGHVYSTFREDTTLKLRLSVAQPEPAPTATPAAPAPARRAAAGAADQAVKVLDDQAGTRTGVT